MKNAQQEADLCNVQANIRYGNSHSYGYKNSSSEVGITSVETESIKGKTCYIITLKPIQQPNNYNITSYNGYSLEKIAELQIRFLLLNEIPSNQNKGNDLMLNCIITGSSYSNKSKSFIFNDIRKKWKNNTEMFLINARLAAVHLLKSKNVVENILSLKLSLSKNVLSIDFRGQIQHIQHTQNTYLNQESKTVEVKGKCTL